ncbi:MAG: N-acetylmuramoyl-L-alanine amidase-like domain-containing protein [Muribaculaceae bacterium]
MKPSSILTLTRAVGAAAILICSGLSAKGAMPGEVRFHHEATDTTKISSILAETATHDFANASARTAYIARQFIGTPYVAHTLEGTPEMLTVNVDEVDCTTYVEMVLALSATVAEGRSSWHDYLYQLQQLRYRGGEVSGYGSRLHYICDWVSNNVHRGAITDATTLMPRCSYIVRSIDYMSTNRDKYPALADSVAYADIRHHEMAYRNHRFPYIKTSDLGSKEVKAALREGDVVALVTNMKNLDVTHMGFVVVNNGEPYLLHASSSHGKVEISEVPLTTFLKRNRTLMGVRVLRLTDY